MATEYIPIKDRVRVDARQPAIAAYTLVGVDERTGVYRWQGLCVSDHEATCRGAADTARSAICFACEDVRERCAKLAADRMFPVLVAEILTATGRTKQQTEASLRHECETVAAAIRELVL